MTYDRLLVLGQTHAPEAAAAHLASSGVLTVQASTSNHVPATMEGTALWVGTEGATRLHNAGVELPLLSPGPSWLSTAPGHLLGRKVLCTTAGRLLTDWNGPGVFRLAEQKHGTVSEEKTYRDPASFVAEVGKYRYRLQDLVAGAHVICLSAGQLRRPLPGLHRRWRIVRLYPYRHLNQAGQAGRRLRGHRRGPDRCRDALRPGCSGWHRLAPAPRLQH